MPNPTLRDVLGSVPGLVEAEQGTGSLDQPVSWVHTTELRDPSRYLRGGELVCTVGISLRSVQDCQDLIASLRAAGAAGLCFGVGDVHDDVPGDLVAQCREHQLPLRYLCAQVI